jgi:hypothetical protein
MQVIYINDLDGSPYIVQKPEGQKSLAFLQSLVQGLIESVQLAEGLDLWVNEEGLFRSDFSVNEFATTLAGEGYRLVGPAVIAGYDEEGNTTGVDDDIRTMLSVFGKVFSAEEVNAVRAEQLAKIKEGASV